MYNEGFPLNAYVVFDNNAVVGICEFCLSLYKDRPFFEAVSSACSDVGQILSAIKQFSKQNDVFTTQCVLDEFKPEYGELSKHKGFHALFCDQLKDFIRSQVKPLDTNLEFINQIRRIPQSPRMFGLNLSGLSDQDLSLFVLALQLSNESNERVYILTDEEKLCRFTSWGKKRLEVRELCAHPDKVEALHSMLYLDSVHRRCAISTEQIYKMYAYRSYQQMARRMLSGTTMGEMITETYGMILQMINESSVIKRGMVGVAA